MRRQRRSADPYVVLLLLQLLQKINELPWKPPVTLAVMAFNALVYFKDQFLPYELADLVPSIRAGCLQPYAIIFGGQWARLVWSAFLHLDDMHLYYNMTSLLIKGVQLERRLGSFRFALLLSELLLLSHGIMAGSCAWLGETYKEYRSLSRGTCAAGFSAVLFALKYVITYSEEGWSYPMGLGVPVPTKYIAWAELLLIHYLVPEASFAGHLAGILGGMTHVHLVARCIPAVSRWSRSLRRLLSGRSTGWRGAGTPRTSGTRPPPTPRPTAPHTHHNTHHTTAPHQQHAPSAQASAPPPMERSGVHGAGGMHGEGVRGDVGVGVSTGLTADELRLRAAAAAEARAGAVPGRRR